MIERHITIERNQHGIPVHNGSPSAQLTVSSTEDGRVDVNVLGDRDALTRLAEYLIGVSETPGFHTHIDVESDSIRWLTIGNID